MSIRDEDTALKRENEGLRRRLQEESIDSRSLITQFDDLAAESGAWVWRIDIDGRYTFASELVEEILGYKPEEILGRPFYEFFHPEDQERLKRLAMDAIASGRPFLGLRNRNVRKDGATVILETTGFPIISADGEITGYYGGDRDVTLFVQAEKAKQESEAIFHHIFDELGDAVYVTLWDEDGTRRIVEANKEALRRVRGRREDLMGKGLLRDFPIRRIEPDLGIIKNTLDCGETARYVINKTCPDGKDRWEEVVEVPITHGGRKASLAVNRDITEQKRLEDELRAGREQWRVQYKGSPLPTLTWQHVDGDFELIDYNDALEEMVEGKIAPFLGRKASDMYSDRPEIIAGIKECYETHRTLQGEIEHRFVTTGETLTLWVTTGFLPPDRILVYLSDISARKRMERDLLAANKDLQRILDVMGEGVVVLNAEGKMTRLNEKACELFGRSEAELLGNDYSFWTHPDSCELMASEQRKRKRGERSVYEARLLRSDRKAFWAKIIAVPVIGNDAEFQGSVGCLQDITQEKHALEELRKLHDFNEQLIKTASVWINVTDMDGRIVLWNDEAEEISGYSRQEVLGSDKVWEWLYPDAEYRAEIWRGQHEIGRGKSGSERIETAICRKDGAERIIQWYGRQLYGAQGKPDGWVIVGHDVTETKHNLQRLQDYAAQVAELSREKTRFLSVASHELRTPLTIIRGFIDLMSEENLGSDQREKVERIQGQLDRFTELLDDLLSVSRIDSGESNLSLGLIDLSAITRRCVDLLAAQAADKGITVSLDDGQGPVIAHSDTSAVMQIVTNILLNAISYTHSGGRIQVSVSRLPSKAQILISDTGIGICEAEQQLIFNEFHRTDRARKMKAGGNGLGLAIVKRLLDDMNGQIWVRSEGENKGTTVLITLPAVPHEGSGDERPKADSDL
ncbi:PAS domain S-box protein [Candidatus Bipolaricaulota bacterium]|nr:PAS domain S-box protein [Candidatus Bipolaricaulota bacterium]